MNLTVGCAHNVLSLFLLSNSSTVWSRTNDGAEGLHIFGSSYKILLGNRVPNNGKINIKPKKGRMLSAIASSTTVRVLNNILIILRDMLLWTKQV
jgi:hypothetical protein